jgi:hypothetical protein
VYPAIYRDLWGDDVFVQRSADAQAAILQVGTRKSSLLALKCLIPVEMLLAGAG